MCGTHPARGDETTDHARLSSRRGSNQTSDFGARSTQWTADVGCGNSRIAGSVAPCMGWLRGVLGERDASKLLSLRDVLTVLGDDGVDGRSCAEVPLADVVGSVNRFGDFDQRFRPLNSAVRHRRASLTDAIRAGFHPPPVDLIQVGDLYFVVDGHHRVSIACALGRDTILAKVLRVCTTAYGLCRLRPEHLAAKSAEREFLERVPLDVVLRCSLWLDCASDWRRLADAAEAWGFRHSLVTGRVLDRCDLARSWWTEEVVPAVEAARRAGRADALRDVQIYLDVLTAAARHTRSISELAGQRDGSRRQVSSPSR